MVYDFLLRRINLDTREESWVGRRADIPLEIWFNNDADKDFYAPDYKSGHTKVASLKVNIGGVIYKNSFPVQTFYKAMDGKYPYRFTCLVTFVNGASVYYSTIIEEKPENFDVHVNHPEGG
jgi:hypothetical protein